MPKRGLEVIWGNTLKGGGHDSLVSLVVGSPPRATSKADSHRGLA